jgi:hypothetical protein
MSEFDAYEKFLKKISNQDPRSELRDYIEKDNEIKKPTFVRRLGDRSISGSQVGDPGPTEPPLIDYSKFSEADPSMDYLRKPIDHPGPEPSIDDPGPEPPVDYSEQPEPVDRTVRAETSVPRHYVSEMTNEQKDAAEDLSDEEHISYYGACMKMGFYPDEEHSVHHKTEREIAEEVTARGLRAIHEALRKAGHDDSNINY